MTGSRGALLLALVIAAGCTEPSEVSSVSDERGSLAAHASNTDRPVTATLADADTALAPALQIRGDGLGTYQNSSALISTIQGIGAWLLDSESPRNGTRQVSLDFGHPIAGSGPGGGSPIAVASALYRVRMISKCNLYGSSMLTLAPGQSMPCPLHIAFTSGGASYAIQMNPLQSAGEPYPDTNYGTITCVHPVAGAGACTQWRITPSGTYVDVGGATRYRNVGKLLKYVTSKGKTTAVNQGNFYFSFAIGVTNP